MIANKSVQAAQRRRAGPIEPPRNTGPTTSIKSSQIFNQQQQFSRQNSIPGKVPSQHNVTQRQYVPEQSQRTVDINNTVNTSNPKITVANAIAIITSRLLSLESKVTELTSLGMYSQTQNTSDESFNMNNIILEDIIHRLEGLEKQSMSKEQTQTQTDVSPDVKSQIELHTKAIKQSELISSTLVKSNQNMKSMLDTVKTDILDTKNKLNDLQTVLFENNCKMKDLEQHMSSFVTSASNMNTSVDATTGMDVSSGDDMTSFGEQGASMDVITCEDMNMNIDTSSIELTINELAVAEPEPIYFNDIDLSNLKEFVKNELHVNS